MKCPGCDNESNKAIYMGFPLRLCTNEDCLTLFGFWSWIMDIVPFNGWFYIYEGNYFIALYYWLLDKEED
jgi:hypothetical protein|tara:strand:+ start:1562 stop:1771 length:210 start_codon:yes stop_codon:yes gene_type:complete